MTESKKIIPDSKYTAPTPETGSHTGLAESVKNEDNREQPPAREPLEKTPAEIAKIEAILSQIDENTKPSHQALPEQPVSQQTTEIVIINGQKYTVEYVPREDIYPAYGYGGGNSAVVRQDLPPRVKNFVRAHELYHCRDRSNFGGWLGREIRANVIPGLKDPIGLAATVWATITDIDRIKFYLRRIKEGR